jgi:hypothetical protein
MQKRSVYGHCHENRGEGLEVMGYWKEKKKFEDKCGGRDLSHL